MSALGRTTVEHLLCTIYVRELMSNPVTTARPDDSVEDAARRMLAARVGLLPVVGDDRVVGIVTETDLLRYVGGGGL